MVKTIGRIIGFVLLGANALGQNYIQFVENKGQWGKDIRFKGDMQNGAFALQKTGYRVLLHNRQDLNRIAASMHHPGGENASGVQKQLDASSKAKDIPGSGDNGSSANLSLRSHVYEMRFLNANANPQAAPDKPLSSYNNYFIGNDSSQWAANCRIYQAVTYRNIYPGIDVRYYTSGGVLKYDFIVQPGANFENIAMYFDGVDGLKLVKGDLHIQTSVDEVVEKAPYAYQLINDKRVELSCRFEVKGNILRFKIDGSYARNAVTVIDPSLIFSTYTGSTLDNWGYTATYDGKGNFYAGGIVLFGSSGAFPVSNGAFQTTPGGGNNATGEPTPGGFDIGIMKFDPTGANRVYATYLGGSGNEQPHSMVVDGAGNLIVAGRTASSNYPLKGKLQTYGPLGGLQDIIITKFNATGTALIGSIRVGGNGDDGVNIRAKYQQPIGAESIDRNYGDDARSEVILDGAGNIYVASCTQSTNFPTTATSPQTTLGGFNAVKRGQDAVVMKFTPDLNTVLFSDLIGGSDDDAAFVLAINPSNGNLFVGGATASNDFPGLKIGTKYPSFQGGVCDGFVAEFTNTGVLVRDSYFGTPGTDMIYGIQFDKYGFPYITGTTTGSWPILNAAFSQPGGKQFISKLKPDLSDYVYSTVFGTNSTSPNLSLTAFLVDRCENVYVSGWGGTTDVQEQFPNSYTNGLPVTPDAFQKRTDGSDFYFFVLEKNAASQLYGSFFGQYGGFGEHVDGGTSRFDASGVIYQAICANCSAKLTNPADFFPTTPGVWSPTNGSTDCNLAAVKIAFNLAGVGAGVTASINGVPRDTAGCVPLTADFTDTLAQGKKYVWNFDDGSPSVTTTTPSVSHTFNTVGLYRVSLVSIDSSTCNIADTARITMRVRDDQAYLVFNSTKLPPCASLAYQFNNTSTSIRPFTSTSFRWDFGDGATQVAGTGPVTHTYAAPGTYDVKLILIDTSYCNEPDSLVKKIRLSTNVKAQFETPAAGCVPYNAVFNNTSLGGTDFLWQFGDGTTSTAADPTHLYSTAGTYQVRLIATDTNTCNKVDTSAYFTIVVSPYPKSSFTYSPQPTQTNEPVSFLNNSTGGARYKWLYGDGDTLMTIQADTVVQHLYHATGTFNTCLAVYNNYGCTDTSCQSISVVILNEIDVPNAFSPNGDGRNDKIYVRGYGISKMTWKIYNRWGTLVFQTSDPNEGWDGTYKGVLQPQEVYHYTLLIEYGGKEKATKKGDITLLR